MVIQNQTATDTTNEIEEVFDHDLAQDIKQKSVSGAASYMLRTLLLYGMNFATAAVLAAYLSPTDFGIFALVSQIVSLLAFFSDIGLASALIQKKDEPTLTEYRAVFTVQQILSWLIFGATVALAVSRVLEPKVGINGVMVLLALGFSFPLTTLKTIPSIMLERKLEFSKITIPHIAEQVVFSAIVILMVRTGMGVMTYFYAILARATIGVIIMFFLKRWPIGLSLDKVAIKAMIGVGVKFQLNDFIARIKDQLFYILLGLFLPLSQYGYISFCKQYSELPYDLTVQNIIAITFPTYARLQSDKNLLRKAIEKTLFFITVSIFPMLVGMCVFIIPFIQLIPRYHKWQPALFSFILFTLSIAWAAVSTPLTNTLNAIGQINTTLKLMVMWTVLTWVLTPILVFFFGFNGVALSAFVISFSSIMPIYYVRKIVDIRVWENTWRQLFASVVMAGVGAALLPVWSQSFVVMTVGVVFTLMVYGGTLMLVGREKVFAEVRSLRKRKV